MYWSDVDHPKRFAGLTKDVSREDIVLVGALLRSGRTVERYLGWAECRICGLMLGTKDIGRFGFVWPEKAEHYIEAHGVWTPGLTAFVAQLKAAKALRAAENRP